VDDFNTLETSFSQKICMAAEHAIKFKFPKIQNLSVSMDDDGDVLVIFDETIYTQKEVKDFLDEFRILKQPTK